jgi:ABC-type sugar transport system ATPase subunit
LNLENDVRYLSGGNQQKVVISKWLYKDSEIFIFDEPTRGIDVNTKAEIYALMVDMVKQGKAIIMVSSDMPELISISDRVLVIKDGAVAAELKGDEITEHNIIVKTL